MNPYSKVNERISRYGDSSGGIGWQKLMLSLYDPEIAFGYRECTSSFGPEDIKLALEVLTHFHKVGEDEGLLQTGRFIYEMNRPLYEQGLARRNCKS